MTLINYNAYHKARDDFYMSQLMKTYGVISGQLKSILLWLDASSVDSEKLIQAKLKEIDWLRAVPFILMHLACFLVFYVGFSYFAFLTAVAFYFIRMFAITGFYHRYFSHRAFRTSRSMQFVFALMGATAVQRGPLWWASHHRIHHATADKENDQHSPRTHGFLWSHTGWFLSKRNFVTHTERVSDFEKFPELKFLDRFDVLVPVLMTVIIYFTGEWLSVSNPQLDTNGLQMLVWMFFISTVFLYHGTFTINSLAHQFGRKVFKSKDDSRNNFWLALITMGEGWHNNHHFYPGSARQGFMWWEIDMTYYGLLLLEKTGLIWDLKKVPAFVYEKRNVL